jgi:hypothetical protein
MGEGVGVAIIPSLQEQEVSDSAARVNTIIIFRFLFKGFRLLCA